jgi:hypothetical protein
MRMSASYFLYAAFVARGLFQDPGALAHARAGDELLFRHGCGDFFVFCAHDGDAICNSLPMSSGCVSNFTRVLTSRMKGHSGLLPRAARAHRHAAGTNTTACSMLRNNGMAVGRDQLSAVTRWGGWSQRNGTDTVTETYESVAVDEHLNVFGLAYGVGMEASVWEERLRQFQGEVYPPPKPPPRESGGAVLPWERKVEAVRDDPVVRAAVAECDAACGELVLAAMSDPRVMVVERYVEAHEAVRLFSAMPHADAVVGRAERSIAVAVSAVQHSTSVALRVFRDEVQAHLAEHGYRAVSHIEHLGVALLPDGGCSSPLFVDVANSVDGGNVVAGRSLPFARGESLCEVLGAAGAPWSYRRL